MKKYVILAMALILANSCSKVDEKVKQAREAKDAISQVTRMAKATEGLKSDIEKLSEVEPLTNEELKAWLPGEISGMKRTAYRAGETALLNIASISADYENEDKSRKLKIVLTDGAGPTAATMIAGMKMGLAQDFEEENEEGFRRTVKRNGTKVIEEQSRNNSKVQLLQKDRFHLEASATNMDIEELWKAVEELNLNKLPTM